MDYLKRNGTWSETFKEDAYKFAAQGQRLDISFKITWTLGLAARQGLGFIVQTWSWLNKKLIKNYSLALVCSGHIQR